jgi:uridine kinase
VFVDGVLILCHRNLVRRFDFTVYVHATDETRLARRIERDATHRGRTRESVAEQWNTTVLPMHRQFVEPYQHIADMGIDNNDAFPDLRPIVKRIAAIQDTDAK